MSWYTDAGQTIRDILSMVPEEEERPRIFCETGILQCATTQLACVYFDRVIAIELSDELFASAQASYGGGRIEFVHGDSAEKISEVCAIDENICFFLDAHFFTAGSKDWPGKWPVASEAPFPLWEELRQIDARKGAQDIVIVDDVHAFGRRNHPGGPEWGNTNPASIKSKFVRREVVSDQVIGDQYVLVVR